MSRLLHHLGRWSATHPWRMLALWTLVAALAIGAAGAVGGEFDDDYTMPGTSSGNAQELLDDHFPELSGATATVVLQQDGGVPQEVVTDLTGAISALDHVTQVTPQASPDGATVGVGVQYDLPVTEVTEVDGFAALEDTTLEVTEGTDVRVEFGGWVTEAAQEIEGTAEMIGMVVALVILLVAFGSIVAAGLPLATALIGLGIGSAAIAVLAATTQVSSVAPTLATMVGLGVGIDYALFVLTRHREGLRRGLTVPQAAADATATAGQAVLFAGTAVIISLGGLALCGVPNLVTLGAAPGMVVAVSMFAAVTLVPALMGLAKMRVFGRRERREIASGQAQHPAGSGREPLAVRWAHVVARRPVIWGVAAATLLLALGAPAFAMRTGQPDAGTAGEDTTVRQAHDLMTEAFGAGSLNPIVLAVDTSRVSASEVDALAASVAADSGVASVSPALVSDDGAASVVTVTPTTGAQDEATGELLDRMRAELPDGVFVTGATAINADFSDRMSERFPWVVGAVVLTSMLLLLVAFRSVAVPIKAAVMNLLSLGAAMGVLTAIFTWGWGSSLLGVPAGAPIPAYLPVITFAILFGLSMDYEVFIMSRIREEWLRRGDSHGAVMGGLGSTAKVVTSAAAIMVAVFAGFAADPLVEIKMIGIALATAILVDATVVRMVLLPSSMTLLGERAWWLPAWLDQVLPHVELHGAEALPVDESTPGDESESSLDDELRVLEAESEGMRRLTL
jgi:RND superfamily putative drug exporter